MDWRKAACADYPSPEDFFPEPRIGTGRGTKPNPDIERVKAICHGCEIRLDCLNDALQDNRRYGIWGGTTEADRAELKGKPRVRYDR